MDNVEIPMPKGAKRNTGLTIWLWLMIIFGVIGVLSNFGSVLTGIDVGYDSWALIILGLLGIANLVLISWIFKWQIKGFQGLVVTAVIAIVINLTQGVGIWAVIFGVLSPAILYLFMKSQWKQFK